MGSLLHASKASLVWQGLCAPTTKSRGSISLVEVSRLPAHESIFLSGSHRLASEMYQLRKRHQAGRRLQFTARASGEGSEGEDSDASRDANGTDSVQVRDRPKDPLGTADMMKLFNDAQQNMLYLNKQRLVAMEELQKAERDRELLLNRVASLEAESQATVMEKDVLMGKLKAAEAALALAESRGGSSMSGRSSERKGKVRNDPPPIWSALLLRVDSLLLAGAINTNQAAALRTLAWNRDVQAAEVLTEMGDRDDRQLAGALVQLLDAGRRRGVHVIHVCTEMAPVAHAGSLGTYIMELCASLRRKGHLVEVILPKYASLDTSMVEELRELPRTFDSFWNGQMNKNKIWTGTVYGIPVTFIDPQHPSKWFQRERLYDYEDDFERFTYFSRAALDFMLKVTKQPDVIHLHNWQTAAVAPLFWDIFAHQGLGNTRLLFTCHDFKYQCKADPAKLVLCGLDPYQLNRPDRLQDNAQPHLVNLLKGGIVYSNKVTTVSQTYAQDVKSRELGMGLDLTLTQHQNKFMGVLNGLDETTWNPVNDPALPAPISAEEPAAGKGLAKAELRKSLKLPLTSPETGGDPPLVVCIAPAVGEVELELVKAAMECTISRGAQFVFFGASRSPRLQAFLEELERDREADNARLLINYDERTAHLLVGAADILVCPCIYEPTGQLQLVGLKYGAVPVARQLPNLTDSVIDAQDSRRGASEGNGFVFSSAKASDMTGALNRAIEMKLKDPENWEALRRRAMLADNSWDGRACDSYVQAYVAIRRCA